MLNFKKTYFISRPYELHNKIIINIIFIVELCFGTELKITSYVDYLTKKQIGREIVWFQLNKKYGSLVGVFPLIYSSFLIQILSLFFFDLKNLKDRKIEIKTIKVYIMFLTFC